ncbi:hypothetical protein FHG66_17315 [Rubellimicrobium rubrum]|uniref:Cbb3-type cytochrome c oxidase subunit I n=1 Tax=Rubellimicrobium rubrum TaxID=2585369 RepID=A0A5C4MN18_9RHOB|nr:hypothetical protein [Rubellimicrobium rubrum]TNC47224.1 hypothetical protein FHG66_17315 [Rubellimicrobium rubrum]
MRDIAFVFFLAAVLCVTGGMALGIWMGIAQNFTYAPVHAHLNLVGWATMALFAIYYRLTPAAALGWLPRVHALLAIPGVVLMTGGLAAEFSGRPEFLPVAILGSLMTAASMLVFLFTVIRHGFGAAPALSRDERFDAALTPAE